MSKKNLNHTIVVQQSMQLPNRILISGRVVRRLLDPPNKAATLRTILFNIAVFLQRGVGNYPLILKWGDTEINLSTNKMGYFYKEIPIEAAPQKPIYVHHAGKPKRVYLYAVNQPNPTAIVSDVDDTIVVSHSYLWLKNLFTSLLNIPRTRKSVPQMARVYRQFAKQGGHVFYVSSSKWFLYGFVRAFLQLNGFPKGVLFLKSHTHRFFSWGSLWSRVKGRNSHLHKLHKIEQLLAWYPSLNVILVGDSGQKDPEIYYQMLVKYPKNIQAAYIRQVNQKANRKIEPLNNLLLQKGLKTLTTFTEAKQIDISVG